MNFVVDEYLDGRVLHVRFLTQYDLTSTLVRLQEFYESPYDNIRGHYFTLDTFMDTYTYSREGEFTYFTDWIGFNIPGTAINAFKDKFHEWRAKERDILQLTDRFKDNNFYVIGTYQSTDCHEEDTLNHELAHALYNLEPDYKAECERIYATLSEKVKEKVNEKLTHLGYDNSVFPDETQAYFATEKSSLLSLCARFMINSPEIADAVAAYSNNLQRYHDTTR